MNDERFFFFKISSEEDLMGVLEDDACLIEGKPLILQRWHSKLILSKEVPRLIPLWVKIFNIPLQYWNRDGLSRIGSGVGNILFADSLTERMCREASGRLSFAKLLVEVEASKPLPDKVFVHIPCEEGSKPLEVSCRIEYPWRPSWCSKCSIFGHSVNKCPVLIALNAQKVVNSDQVEKGGKDSADIDGFITIQRKWKEKFKEQNNSAKRLVRLGIMGGGIINFMEKKELLLFI